METLGVSTLIINGVCITSLLKGAISVFRLTKCRCPLLTRTALTQTMIVDRAGAHESLLAIRGLGQREQLLDEQQRLGVGLEPGSLRAGLQLLARQRRQLCAHGLAAGRALTA